MPSDSAADFSGRLILPVRDAAGRLTDVRVERAGKSLCLCGRSGPKLEEEAVARSLGAVPRGEDGVPETLPVLLGLGMGHGLRWLLANGLGPVAVVDRDEELLALTREKDLAAAPGVFWLGRREAPDAQSAMRGLGDILEKTGRTGFTPIVHPVCRRLDPAFYADLSARLASHAAFWEAAGARRFATASPRVLFLDSAYFLAREIREALTRLGAEVLPFPAPDRDADGGRFVEELLKAAVRFKPDFLLTVNHMGLDRRGAMTGLLEKLRLPLASWFVDNPHLILHDYAGLVSPWCMLFSWDADMLDGLGALGFAHRAYLPLGTDPVLFAPPAGPLPSGHPWRSRVSFVGASMRSQVDGLLAGLSPFPFVAARYEALAEAFRQSPERGVRTFMREKAPEVHAAWEALPTAEARLDFEMLVTWEATRRYRLERIERLAPFTPLIAGDAGWKTDLAGEGTRWRALGFLDYYRDLPRFYPLSEINFNCASMQMKGAVNQRTFDVPACGAFLLTDRREQMGALFEPGREVVCYDDPGEIGDLVRHYLARPVEREKIVTAARRRILAEHSYEHRLKALCAAMRATFG